jgi:hypothetical protein
MRKNTDFKYGQLREIARASGFSYPYVRKVLIDGDRKNAKVLEVASIIAKNNIELKEKLTAA